MDDSDQKLIAAFQTGATDSFEVLVHRYTNPLYSFLYQIVRDRDVAEDLVQETFIKAWRAANRFTLGRNFKTWLFAIGKNAAFDWLKKKKSLPFSSLDEATGPSFLENIPSDQLLPSSLLEQKEGAARLAGALETVPPLYRAILHLHYQEDYALGEIAELLGEPYDTIKSRHRRALIRLRSVLEPDAPLDRG